jgi:hypothetical protein
VTIDVEQATRLHVYGYPLVYCTDEIVKLSGPESTLIADGVPFNTFGAARSLLGPDAKFVSPNNDTLYLIAPLDLSGGGVLVHTPDTGDRYYVLQVVDAWSNNVAYIGRRATGTAAGDWFLTTADDATPTPEGATRVDVPSDLAVIVGRVQVDGPDDLAAVHAVQDGFTITEVGSRPAGGAVPTPDPRVDGDLVPWEKLRVALRRFPPPDGDADLLALCAEAGLLDEESPFVDPSDELVRALSKGRDDGIALIESLASGAGSMPGAWTSALHMFDYNLDRCGLGTIDSPDWKIADRNTAYVTRAVAARGGLWGNHGYEADYEVVHQDADGQPLTGEHRYEVTFSPPPPADAFWSLTMYDTPDYYLVDNPIDRYSIGDRTPGLRTDADGSVTIRLQHEAPGGDDDTNWLPAPAGPFRPILRIYQPGPAVLDGSYTPPPVRRIG